MNVREAAARLEVSQATIYALVAAGMIRHYRIGVGRGSIKISEAHLDEYLKSAEPGPKKPPPAGPAGPSKLRHVRLP